MELTEKELLTVLLAIQINPQASIHPKLKKQILEAFKDINTRFQSDSPPIDLAFLAIG